jgi:DDE superfamily endonuclease
MARMEDVLDLYAQTPNVKVARLCFDECPCQLLADLVDPLPMQPGVVSKQDYEYIRQGTAVILLAYDLDTGQRYVQVRPQRTKRDYAEFMRWLVTTHYANVEKVQLVQDNLNTHSYGAFYEHLPTEQAHALMQKLEFHFTPKHASWLNMAELEFSALARQCLDQRFATLSHLQQAVQAWAELRNRAAIRIKWSFTTQDARHKLRRYYLNLNSEN